MKKAIILAGGRGTRLSPLTDGIPKPLVPFLGKTLIERIIEKLTKSGIEKIMITTAYRSDMIKNKIGRHFGGAVIEYLEEKVPLGTAGGLVFAREILALSENEDFLVISGDCVCDFDLVKAKEAHDRNGACATVITTECDNPLEYGVVLSKSGGLITSFNEKPCWSQVGGCRVNTGVYILSSKVIDLVPKNAPFDFSNDLFPAMLEKGLRLYEHTDFGYWCDVGSVESYYKCCIDALNGKIGNFDSEQKVFSHTDGIKITAPCFIPHEVQIEKGAEIGPNVILSSRCHIGKNCEIVGSILHGGVRVCENSRIEGAVVCENAEIGKRAGVCGGSVIAKGVKIPESSYIPSSSTITQSVHEPLTKNENYFEKNNDFFDLEQGIFLGTEKNASRICQSCARSCARIGYILSKTMGTGAKIGVMHDETDCANMYFTALVSGLGSGDAFVFDYGEGFESLARYESVFFGTDCFVFVYTDKESRVVFARIFNKNGLEPSRDFERRFNLNMQNIKEEFTSFKSDKIYRMVDATTRYFFEICENFKGFCGSDGIFGTRLAFSDTERKDMQLLKEAFEKLGGECVTKKQAQEMSLPIISHGEDGVFVTQSNYTLDRYHITSAILSAQKEKSPVALPFLSPESYKNLAGGNIFYYPEHSVRRFYIPKELLRSGYCLRDDVLLCARFISLLFKTKKNVSGFYFELPLFGYSEKTIRLPDGFSKSVVIKRLSKNLSPTGSGDTFEGIKLSYPNGCVTVVPGKAQMFKIFSESRNAEMAKELCDIASEDILAKENE